MFSLEKSYGFNKKLADEGVKMVVGPDAITDYVVVCKMSNDRYRAKLSSMMIANRKVLEILKSQDEAAHSKKDNEIFCEVLAETILVGWGSGITDGGKPVTYSVENAKELLIKYPDFRSDIIDFANNKANYPIEIDLEDIKKK